ncbi:PREDICTED: 3-phosphoinositide-dependent protein kinase 1-like [Acropora digitifera]|uniref:3-phosphoinositide-dependent protein kinase 1-like n=1 Tax=Acropora digitifera TaxID=70779 RepID=UPI000779F3CD|nr:PREDICTED: 3-phosphoinositide-dependent protein kinase 1-like [Acropora digitifera]
MAENGEKVKATPNSSSSSPQSPASPSLSSTSSQPIKKKRPEDFKFGKILGEGSFSTVYVVREISTGKEYAMKVLEKRHMIREKKTQYVTREKEVLSKLNHPFFVRLYFTFQDKEKLYFGLSYAKKGELLPYIIKLGSFDLNCSRFYSAEVVSALEHLHGLGIIHRDLKPENILLDADMHIKITDFGTAKIISGTEVNQKGNCNKKRIPIFIDLRNYARSLWFWPQPFFFSLSFLEIKWENLSNSTPPDLLPYLPSTSTDQEGLRSKYKVSFPDSDEEYDEFDEQLLRKVGLSDEDIKPSERKHILQLTDSEREERLLKQERESPWYEAVGLKCARSISRLSTSQLSRVFSTKLQSIPVMKTTDVCVRPQGLFPRRRQLILTDGPHLYYVDAAAMVLKGEIPWTKDLRPEAKNFEVFFIHTPKRIYYLEDHTGYAMEWVKKIEEVHRAYFGDTTSF